MITRNTLTVTEGTSKWGGKQATITVTGAEPSGYPFERTYELRSTEGLGELPGIKDRPEIHVFETGGSRDEWHGAFPTNDMGEAIDSLVDYLREIAARDAAEWATMGTRSDLRDALTTFEDLLSARIRPGAWKQQWEAVKDAVAAVEATLFAPATGAAVSETKES